MFAHVVICVCVCAWAVRGTAKGKRGLWGWGRHGLTFKEEGLVPVGVQVLPLHLGLQLVLLVWQQVDLDEGVAGAAEVLGRQLLGLHDLHDERGLLEVVADAELDPAQVLSATALVGLVLLGAWGELGAGERQAALGRILLPRGPLHSPAGLGGPPVPKAGPALESCLRPRPITTWGWWQYLSCSQLGGEEAKCLDQDHTRRGGRARTTPEPQSHVHPTPQQQPLLTAPGLPPTPSFTTGCFASPGAPRDPSSRLLLCTLPSALREGPL